MAHRRDEFVLPLAGGLAGREMLQPLRTPIDSVEQLAALLGDALAALDEAGQGRLLEKYKSDRAMTRALNAAFATANTRNDDPAVAWKLSWKRWEAVIRATDDLDGPYMRNTISYTNPDLDLEGVLRDLDEVAREMLPLVERVVAEKLAPRFDLLARVPRSLCGICASCDWVIRPDDIVALGADASKLLLAWIDADGEARGETREQRLERATELDEDTLPDAGFELDRKVFRAFAEGGQPAAKRRPSR
jgi:hypothetical protein